MPELPEVETTKTSLKSLLNKTVKSVQINFPRLRYPIPKDLDTLVGMQLVAVRRRAKYLLLDFADAEHRKTLLIHLGMSGSLQQHIDMPPRKHDHMLMAFGDDGHDDDTEIMLHYHDPRRFGMILWVENDDYIDTPDTAERFLDKLGPEPLDDAFNIDYLRATIFPNNKKPLAKPIKTVIMDQSVVVGVGNIYAAESLFLSCIHPLTPAYQVKDDKLEDLVQHIKAVLNRAILKGGSSLRDFTFGNEKTGYFQQTLLVYGRAGEPCRVCGSLLENTKIGGRASVYCPNCQPMNSAHIIG